MIKVNHLHKVFVIRQKGLGMKESLKSFVKKTHSIKEAVKDISFTIDEGEIVGLASNTNRFQKENGYSPHYYWVCSRFLLS